MFCITANDWEKPSDFNMYGYLPPDCAIFNEFWGDTAVLHDLQSSNQIPESTIKDLWPGSES